MTTKYIVQHTGYPVAGRPIRPGEWCEKSRHASERAAWNAIRKYNKHLSQGSWDDHYRVIAPNDTICDYDRYLAEECELDYRRRNKS